MNKITATEARAAIKTISEFCKQVNFFDCEDSKCPIGVWCHGDRERFLPDEWRVGE